MTKSILKIVLWSLIIILCILAVILGILIIKRGGFFKSIKGDGNVITKEFELDDFNEFSLSRLSVKDIDTNVTFTKSETNKLIVQTDSNLINEEFSLEKKSEGKNINYHGKYYYTYKPTELNIEVFYDTLTKVSFSGNQKVELGTIDKGITINASGAVKITSDIHTEEDVSLFLSGSCNLSLTGTAGNLKIKSSGSSILTSSLQLTNTDIDISGSAKINLNGSSDDFDIKISGSANVNAKDFNTNNSIIKVSGSAKIEVSVSDKLDVTISGAGTVKYYGNPHITQKISGAGQIIEG